MPRNEKGCIHYRDQTQKCDEEGQQNFEADPEKAHAGCYVLTHGSSPPKLWFSEPMPASQDKNARTGPSRKFLNHQRPGPRKRKFIYPAKGHQ